MTNLDRWWSSHVADLRFDRAPMYLSIIFACLCVAISVNIIGPSPESPIYGIPKLMRDLLSVTLSIGCLVALFGAFAGSKLFLPNINRKTTYKIGVAASPAIISAMVVYSWISTSNVESFYAALGTMIGPAIALGSFANAVIFIFELRRISRNIPKAIKELDGRNSLGHNDVE